MTGVAFALEHVFSVGAALALTLLWITMTGPLTG